MTSAADLVETLSARLGHEFSVDAGLDRVAAEVARLENPSEALDATQQQLRARADALQRAAKEVAKLASAARRLRLTLPFSPEGWPQERDHLAELGARDGWQAGEAWWGFVLSAAADYRLEALHRLVDEGPLPDSCEPLRRRTRACIRGLELRSWHVAAPMLTLGLEPSATPVPRRRRAKDLQRLRLMLARLALADDQPRVVPDLLDADPEVTSSPAARALCGRSRRMLGDVAEADALEAEARALAPQDLDVAMGLIQETRTAGIWDQALEVARVAVDAMANLVDVDHDLGRLLTPAVELWVAVAERMIREQSSAAADRALREAQRINGGTDDRLTALIGQTRAAMLGDRPRAEALLDAGNAWLAAGEIDTAADRYASALAVITEADDPELWAALVFRHADCVATSAVAQPLGLVHDDLEVAYERTLAAQAIAGATDRDPWSYATETDLHMALARDPAATRSEHYWRGLLAAARNVALRPTASRPWDGLAAAAGELACPRLALTFAERSVALGGDRTGLVVWLVGTGRNRDAARLLEGATDPWSTCVLGFLTLRTGSPQEATRLLSAVPIDPSWAFAREAWLESLLLGGRADEAAVRAQEFLDELRGYDDEFDLLLKHSVFARICGDLDSAVRYGELAARAEVAQDRGTGLLAFGQALLLVGHLEEGMARLERAVALRGLADLQDWYDVDRPVLEALGRARGARLPDLGALDDAIARRRAELESYDLLSELDHADTGGADADSARQARQLVGVLRALCLGDLDGAESLLELLDRRFAPERSSLRVHLEALRHPRPEDDAAGDGDGAVGDGAATEPVRTLLLGLPASWFEGFSDPLTQHPIFLRYLPELRALSHWEIPQVRVVARADLEPDQFTVGEDDAVLASGTVLPNARACGPLQLEVLPEHLRSVAAPDPQTGLLWMPSDSFEADDALATLLTRDGCEVALDSLAEAARRESTAEETL